MAVGYDTSTQSVRTGTADPHEFGFTPASGAKGILVAALNYTSATDQITSISYGGLTLTEVVTASDSAGEPTHVSWWFNGNVAGRTGDTVSVDFSSATDDDYVFVAVSLTGARPLVVQDSDFISGDTTNPQKALQYSSKTCLSFCALAGGASAVGSYTLLSGMSTVQSNDSGQEIQRVDRQTSAGTSDFTIGYSYATSDDVAFAAVAITEGDVAGSYVASGTLGDVTGTGTTATTRLWNYVASGTLGDVTGTGTTATARVWTYEGGVGGKRIGDVSGAAVTAFVEAPSTVTYSYTGTGSLGDLTGTGTTATTRLWGYTGTGSLGDVTGAATTATTRLWGYTGTGTLGDVTGAATTTFVSAGTTTYTYTGSGSIGELTGTGTTATTRLWGYTGTGSLGDVTGTATTAAVPTGTTTYTYTGTGSLGTVEGTGATASARLWGFIGAGSLGSLDGAAATASVRLWGFIGAGTFGTVSGAAVAAYTSALAGTVAPWFEWRVPAEDREYVVPFEDREYVVPFEDREFEV